jgi:hypothetical protein
VDIPLGCNVTVVQRKASVVGEDAISESRLLLPRLPKSLSQHSYWTHIKPPLHEPLGCAKVCSRPHELLGPLSCLQDKRVVLSLPHYAYIVTFSTQRPHDCVCHGNKWRHSHSLDLWYTFTRVTLVHLFCCRLFQFLLHLPFLFIIAHAWLPQAWITPSMKSDSRVCVSCVKSRKSLPSTVLGIHYMAIFGN